MIQLQFSNYLVCHQGGQSWYTLPRLLSQNLQTIQQHYQQLSLFLLGGVFYMNQIKWHHDSLLCIKESLNLSYCQIFVQSLAFSSSRTGTSSWLLINPSCCWRISAFGLPNPPGCCHQFSQFNLPCSGFPFIAEGLKINLHFWLYFVLFTCNFGIS